MNKKRLILGIFFLVLFSPVFLAGLMSSLLEAYFVAGRATASDLFDLINEKLGD
jgi:hypothetical protein